MKPRSVPLPRRSVEPGHPVAGSPRGACSRRRARVGMPAVALAALLLAAGCSTGGAPDPDAGPATTEATTSAAPAPTSSAAPTTEAASPSAAAPTTEPAAEPSGAASSAAAPGPSTKRPTSPSASASPSAEKPTEEPSDGQKGEGSAPAPASQPAGSRGSVEDRLAAAQPPSQWGRSPIGRTSSSADRNTDFYQHAGMFHDDNGMAMGTITGAMVQNSELAGGLSTPDGTEYALDSCSGSTRIGTKDAVRCTMSGAGGKTLHVYMRATPTPFGHPGLLMHFTADEQAAQFAMPGSRAMAVGSASGTSSDPSGVTPDEAAWMLGQAILTQHDHEWDGSPDPRSTCQIRDGGVHVVCSATGTPEGGKADGLWYGTYQPSDSGRVQYLFTTLPEK